MSHPTDGPWEFSGDAIWATSPFNARFKVATVTFPSPMNGIDGHANGKVLGAARELYEAALTMAHAEDSGGEAWWRGFAELKAALKKAGGRFPSMDQL